MITWIIIEIFFSLSSAVISAYLLIFFGMWFFNCSDKLLAQVNTCLYLYLLSMPFAWQYAVNLE